MAAPSDFSGAGERRARPSTVAENTETRISGSKAGTVPSSSGRVRKMAAATNIAPENQYFYEDVVYRMDKRGNVVFGIVMENDDLDLSDESSDNEENLPKRKKGEIRMIWHPSGVEELVNCKKVSTWHLWRHNWIHCNPAIVAAQCISIFCLDFLTYIFCICHLTSI